MLKKITIENQDAVYINDEKNDVVRLMECYLYNVKVEKDKIRFHFKELLEHDFIFTIKNFRLTKMNSFEEGPEKLESASKNSLRNGSVDFPDKLATLSLYGANDEPTYEGKNEITIGDAVAVGLLLTNTRFGMFLEITGEDFQIEEINSTNE